MTGFTPNFRKMANMATEGLIVKPLLHKYFYEAKFAKEWTVAFRQQDTFREPDGWFHPSSHPLLKPRQLWLYLNDPKAWAQTEFDYSIRMSILMGSALHDFVEMALEDIGLLMRPKGKCPTCHRRQPQECKEHGFADEATKTRGHLDGVIRWGEDHTSIGGFEFKSANPFTLKGVQDNDVETFKKKWPYYYAQIQEYMRISGLRQFIVLFFGMGNPWEMTEFLIEYDVPFAFEVESRYRLALTSPVMPSPCCGPRSKMSKECPATSCEMKRL
jgi:hypothetical protein